MLELPLAPHLEVVLGEEVERIEKAKRSLNADLVVEGGKGRGRRNLAGLGRSKGGSRGEEGGEDGGLHLGCVIIGICLAK